jgi:predicted lipoprotein with Yx(FWY)xxD motif
MKRLLIAGVVVAVALAIGIAIAIADTNGGGGGGSSSAGSTRPNSAATVSAKQIGGSGDVLVDSKGQALYANDQERNGMVLCKGACLSFWMPLTVNGAPKGSSLSGKLGTVSRPDGGKQVTYNGKLLYTFYLDKPGKVSGDGFDDAFGGQQFSWHVIHANNASSSTGSSQPRGAGITGY